MLRNYTLVTEDVDLAGTMKGPHMKGEKKRWHPEPVAVLGVETFLLYRRSPLSDFSLKNYEFQTTNTSPISSR